jgi:hypothetical protein
VLRSHVADLNADQTSVPFCCPRSSKNYDWIINISKDAVERVDWLSPVHRLYYRQGTVCTADREVPSLDNAPVHYRPLCWSSSCTRCTHNYLVVRSTE